MTAREWVLLVSIVAVGLVSLYQPSPTVDPQQAIIKSVPSIQPDTQPTEPTEIRQSFAYLHPDEGASVPGNPVQTNPEPTPTPEPEPEPTPPNNSTESINTEPDEPEPNDKITSEQPSLDLAHLSVDGVVGTNPGGQPVIILRNRDTNQSKLIEVGETAWSYRVHSASDSTVVIAKDGRQGALTLE